MPDKQKAFSRAKATRRWQKTQQKGTSVKPNQTKRQYKQFRRKTG